MLGRLFRRKSAADDGTSAPDETSDAAPTLRERIKAFIVTAWNWTVLLAAMAGALICVRLTIGFWSSADELQSGSEAFLFRLMAGSTAVAAVFLFWQVGRGVRYLWHRRRG